MTHDDYTGEYKKRCDECGRYEWHDRNGKCPRCYPHCDECGPGYIRNGECDFCTYEETT